MKGHAPKFTNTSKKTASAQSQTPLIQSPAWSQFLTRTLPKKLDILPVICGDIWLLCRDDMPSSKMEVDFIPGG